MPSDPVAAFSAPWSQPSSAQAAKPSLDSRIAALLPKPEEDRWKSVGWRTNLMAARDEAQRVHRPVFLWIMVGNPQGCT